MSLEYKPSLGFVETAGLVIAIQVADAMAKAAEVEIISAHKVDGLRVCVICKGDVAACQAAVETGALLAQSLNGLNGYNIIPSPAEEPDSLMDMLEDIKRKKAARKAAKLARMAAAKGEAAAPAAEKPVIQKLGCVQRRAGCQGHRQHRASKGEGKEFFSFHGRTLLFLGCF